MDDVVIPEENFNEAIKEIELIIDDMSLHGRINRWECRDLTKAVRLLQCKTVMLSTLIPYALNELRKEM